MVLAWSILKILSIYLNLYIYKKNKQINKINLIARLIFYHIGTL